MYKKKYTEQLKTQQRTEMNDEKSYLSQKLQAVYETKKRSGKTKQKI